MTFPKQYDPLIEEPRIQAFWRDRGIHRYNPDSEAPCFSVDTPPPYVSSAHLHVGHAMSYTQAEIIVRYRRMRGDNIYYPMGFDDNGLPTERYVEKKHKMDTRRADRSRFIALCLEETRTGAEVYRNLWDRLGISVDWSLTYSTMDERSRRTAQKSFLELIEKGLIQRRNEPILWCCRCRTSLAQADVETAEMSGELHDIVFEGPGGEALVISTTRPELLGACVALYAHPGDDRYRAITGKQAGVPLYDFTVPILTHRDVDPDYGSGLMMVCTWGDAEDFEKWRENSLETRLILNRDGTLNDDAGALAGLSLTRARSEILNRLKASRQWKGSRKTMRHVGIHERCGTAVEFIPAAQWFVSLLEHRERFLERGRELEWYPSYMKTRFDNWVTGLKWDWCISRQRFYGVPFPVWTCDDCGIPFMAPETMLPVDPVQTPPPTGTECPCGCRAFTGDPDVMDTWMTSSLTPLINGGWAFPEKDPARRMDRVYPQTLRVQAFEIIRTWLFYTIVKSEYHTGSLPWKQVMISGWGLDRSGKKMSKRAGNFVDPMPIIETWSADALRYWSAGAALGNNLRFQERDVKAGKRLLNKLWNAARLASIYLLDTEEHPRELTPGEPTLLDRWMVSAFGRTVSTATAAMDRFDYTGALRSAETFLFRDFCDEYLEIIKPRFKDTGDVPGAMTEAARWTLFRVLQGTVKLLAPFIPHLTEVVHEYLLGKFEGTVSIHRSPWPDPTDFPADEEGEKAGTIYLEIITSVRKVKSEAQRHANSPLKSLVITAPDTQTGLLREMMPDIRAAARADCVEIIDGHGDLVTAYF